MQSQGRETAIAVNVFPNRFEEMAQRLEPYGADGAAARQLFTE